MHIRVRSHFGLALRVLERPEFVNDAARDGGDFAADQFCERLIREPECESTLN
jgi:hypothetical protein